MRHTFAEINLNNLKFNFRSIQKKVKNAGVLAVVKADAYGHGMIKCVQALETLNKKPFMYGVALFEEALELKKAKVTGTDILCFAPLVEEDLNPAISHGIRTTINSRSQLKLIKNIRGNKQLYVHVNVDTGMGRLGIPFNEACNFIEELSSLKNVIVEGVYTHFATSDEKDKQFAFLQLSRYKNLILELNKKNISIAIKHCANSGAVIDIEDSYFDAVRPGISLYGYYPSQETTESIKLKPVMNLISYVTTVKEIEKGDSVSYGRRFIAKKKTNIATLPLGYADGIPRGLTNKMNVLINGKFYKQIGTVTMDRIMIDIGDDKVKPGTKAVLLGVSNRNKIDAWDWSNLLGTIPYEITCGISKRLPRIYIGI